METLTRRRGNHLRYGSQQGVKMSPAAAYTKRLLRRSLPHSMNTEQICNEQRVQMPPRSNRET